MGNKAKRPRPDKPRRPQQPLPPALDLDLMEVEEGQEDQEQQEPEKEPLFKWKGEEYFMTKPKPTVVMDILEAAADKSDIGAMATMLRLAIGSKNWQVLKSIPELSEEEMNGVFERAMTYVMGSLGDLGG